jgi:hypothetical protein
LLVGHRTHESGLGAAPATSELTILTSWDP